jgi:hypothetical protein
VWRFLSNSYGFPGPLDLEEAVDDVVEKLGEQQSLVPARVAPTVYELIGEDHRIGLSQDHVERLAAIVEGDDEKRTKVLEHATQNLGWDTSVMHEWGSVPPDPGVTPSTGPPLTLVHDVQPISLHQWTQSLAANGLMATPPIADAPSCSSQEIEGGRDGGATTVFGRFEIEARLGDLAYATDPMNWPTCSWFFISMTPTAAPTLLPPPDAVGNTAYRRDLEELVGLEDVLTVRTPLTTRYFVGADSLGMEYDLRPGRGGDGKIDVDHGYLLAEQHPTVRDKLIISSQKTFSFVGLDDLPFSFLCEFGWVDMMRAMAQCRAPGGGTT